jgi:hypothetical protein
VIRCVCGCDWVGAMVWSGRQREFLNASQLLDYLICKL